MRFRATLLMSMVLALLAGTTMATRVGAQAYSTSYVTSITYQNVGTSSANVVLTFYAEGSGTPISQSLPSLASNAGASFFVGSASSLSAGFKGAAVLSADQPIVATLVQLPQNSTTVRNRPLSNGFGDGAGAASVRIPSVLKNTFDQNTQFSIQNVDTVANNITVQFVTPTGVVHTETYNNLPPSSVKYYNAGTLTQLGSAFNGSATITATRTSGGGDGKIVATALEMSIAGTGVSAFEGISSDSTTVYMPSALCNAFGLYNSAYAVQNTGSSTATVTASYTYTPDSNTNATPSTAQTVKQIAPGAKASFLGCENMPNGSTGSAVITSVGANIVAIAKVGGGGLSTAAPGASAGSAKLALPYVRYSTTQFNSGARQRTFIAIQNVGASDLAAGSVTVKYIGRDGTVLGTHTLGAIPASGKANSNPTLATGDSAALAEFGFYANGTGGSAIIEGPVGSSLVAVARVSSVGVGEDYNAIPLN